MQDAHLDALKDGIEREVLSDTNSLLAACAAAVQAVCRSGPLMQVSSAGNSAA